MKKIFLFLVLFCIATFSLRAQTSVDSIPTGRSNYLKVYLDGAYFCQDFIRQHISFVNYMRDRHDADVHLLITSQSTGSGGDAYTLFFFGQNNFSGKNDTLNYAASGNNTEDETRTALTHILEMGLMRYVAALPESDNISIAFAEPDSATSAAVETDKWKSWVFSINANGDANGEKSFSSLSISGNVSADKVTDEWKMSFSAGANYNESKYSIEDYSYDSKRTSKNADALVVNSINDHWSAGAEASYSNSTYNNFKAHITLAPALEYDIFPYSGSTSKLFTLFYQVAGEYDDYIDTTLFNKKQEYLFSQSLSASLVLKEKWGSVNMSLSGSNYLHDFSKNSVSFLTSLQWRIVEGLSFDISGYVALVHDQLNLPKEGASTEEVLTQQRVLSTSYTYFGYFGLSYSFGSIFNNAVNPRFDGGGSFFF